MAENLTNREKDIIQEIESIIKWPPGENEVKKILRIEEVIKKYKQ